MSPSVRFSSVMYTFTVFFAIFLTVVRSETSVGTSCGLYSNVAKASYFQSVFPKMTPITVQVDRRDASKTYATLYEQTAKMDREFVAAIDAYVDANVKRYNRLAYEYVRKIVPNLDDERLVEKAIETIGLTRTESDFRFLAFLNENGIRTDAKYDNLLFYLQLKDSRLERSEELLSVLKRIEVLCGDRCKESGTISNSRTDKAAFETLTGEVASKLAEIKRNFTECSKVLGGGGGRDPWIDIADVLQNFEKLKNLPFLNQLFEIKCRIQVVR